MTKLTDVELIRKLRLPHPDLPAWVTDLMVEAATRLAATADAALEQAAAWCAAESDLCQDAVVWGGSHQHVADCHAAAYALRFACDNLRALKGTAK